MRPAWHGVLPWTGYVGAVGPAAGADRRLARDKQALTACHNVGRRRSRSCESAVVNLRRMLTKAGYGVGTADTGANDRDV